MKMKKPLQMQSKTTSDVEVDENENEETTPDAEQTKELLQM